MENKLLAVFGVLSDIQYADIEDNQTGYCSTRYYRNSLNLVQSAINDWKKIESETNLKLKCILQLGDLVDSQSLFKHESEIAFKKAYDTLRLMFDKDDSNTKILNIWGNHEFYNFKRNFLANSLLNTSKYLNQSKKNSNYYSVEISDKLKVICLDQYELSIIGYDRNDPDFIKSYNILTSINKNHNLNSYAGLPKDYTYFLAYNGAIGEDQTKWLINELEESKKKSMKVIVCGHIPIHRRVSSHRALAWDNKELLALLRSYENTVVAVFAGHYHPGGYYKDKSNIHHLTFKAILETSPDSNSYATIYVYNDKISVKGVGKIHSFDINI